MNGMRAQRKKNKNKGGGRKKHNNNNTPTKKQRKKKTRKHTHHTPDARGVIKKEEKKKSMPISTYPMCQSSAQKENDLIGLILVDLHTYIAFFACSSSFLCAHNYRSQQSLVKSTM